ncbi:MAG TPA: VCBS repeat-containing protein, partial [Chryseolinea sp.]
LRHDLVTQVPSLKKKYLKYENFKNETITEIFTSEQLKEAIVLNAYQLSSVVLINQGTGKFTVRELPIEAQSSPVYGIEITDLDGDGKQDILLGGNLYRAKPEVGRYDASYGTFLKGDGTGHFSSVSAKDSGIKIDGEVRDIVSIKRKDGDLLLISRNNDKLIAFKRHSK